MHTFLIGRKLTLENFTHLETQPNNKERRKGKDFLSVSLMLFSIVTVIILATIVLCLFEAKTKTPTSVRQLTLPLRTLWNFTPIRHLLYLLVAGFISSSIGLAINTKRLKRKHDRVRYNLVFLWILSAVGIGTTFLYLFIAYLCQLLTLTVYSA
jgi:heme/copper-type cytochrome/quinol oxidase subunit 2